MKNAAERSKRLSGIIRKHGPAEPPDVAGMDDPVAVLIFSFLLWECNTAKACTAYQHIQTNIVDFNDLRVCMPHETIDMLGVRYPRVEERCDRLRATLRDIYNREHAVTLARLNDAGKREVRKYIESLDGIVPYVAARAMLLSFDTHAIPVDEQLHQRLVREEIIDADVDIAETASWLERQIKASDGVNAHYILQTWVESADKGGSGATRKRKTTKKTGTSKGSTGKSTKKTSGGKRSSTKRSVV